jgi:subtilisin family serine protease
VVRVPAGRDYANALAELERNPQVKAAGPNVIKHVSEVVPGDPLFLNGATGTAMGLTDPFAKNDQWGLLNTDAPRAWEITMGSASVVVALLDTGVNFTQEDTANRFWTNPDEVAGTGVDDDHNGYIDDVHGWDFADGDSNPTDSVSTTLSHGEACASIIAAQGGNHAGMMGAAGGTSPSTGVRIMALRVGTEDNIPVSAEIAALDYARTNGARVATMSFGGPTGGTIEEDAINRAWNDGLYVLAAGGNVGAGNGDLIDLPAGFNNCVAVGATTIFSTQFVGPSTNVILETHAGYSKTGPELEICAPGTHVIAARNSTTGYTDSGEQFTGTSAATPLVAGLAALLFSAKSGLTNVQVRAAINNTAVDLGDSGRDEIFGYGRIDMYEALLSVAGTALHGDTNGNGVVDENDVQPIIAHFGARSGQAGYVASVDANGDGVIDELDLFTVGRNFGKTN